MKLFVDECGDRDGIFKIVSAETDSDYETCDKGWAFKMDMDISSEQVETIRKAFEVVMAFSDAVDFPEKTSNIQEAINNLLGG